MQFDLFFIYENLIMKKALKNKFYVYFFNLNIKIYLIYSFFVLIETNFYQ